MIIQTVFVSEEIHGTKICLKCNEEKPYSEFYVNTYRRNKNNIESNYWYSCKRCDNKLKTIRKRIRKNAPPQPEVCECCNKSSDKLFVDHDHVTLLFRGWICPNCNTGIGNLGDNLEGVMNAVRYLENRQWK